MQLRLIVSTICFFSLSLQAQNISFYKETIVFELHKDTFTVSGDYYFRNDSTGDSRFTIFYPIYRDSCITNFESVSVFNGMTNLFVPFNTTDEGIYFDVHIPANNHVELKIAYFQRLLGKYAVYILKSTQTWGKPLESATYHLISDSIIHINNFSLPPNKETVIKDKNIYSWYKEYFYPDIDFRIEY